MLGCMDRNPSGIASENHQDRRSCCYASLKWASSSLLLVVEASENSDQVMAVCPAMQDVMHHGAVEEVTAKLCAKKGARKGRRSLGEYQLKTLRTARSVTGHKGKSKYSYGKSSSYQSSESKTISKHGTCDFTLQGRCS
jgi:hypothetical protein